MSGVVLSLGVADGTGDFDEGEGGDEVEDNGDAAKGEYEGNLLVFVIRNAAANEVKNFGRDKTSPPDNDDFTVLAFGVMDEIQAVAPKLFHDGNRGNQVGDGDKPPVNGSPWGELKFFYGEGAQVGIASI